MAAAAATVAQVYNVPEDGNEEQCGGCGLPGSLLCCESCPAAYHAECAGYGAHAGRRSAPHCRSDVMLIVGLASPWLKLRLLASRQSGTLLDSVLRFGSSCYDMTTCIGLASKVCRPFACP